MPVMMRCDCNLPGCKVIVADHSLGKCALYRDQRPCQKRVGATTCGKPVRSPYAKAIFCRQHRKYNAKPGRTPSLPGLTFKAPKGGAYAR